MVVECKQRARFRLSHCSDAGDAMVLTRAREAAVGEGGTRTGGRHWKTSIATGLMSIWLNVIATNPAGLATLDPATPWADCFRRAARACLASQKTLNCHRRNPSPTPRIC
jgi:hypothetical protein